MYIKIVGYPNCPHYIRARDTLKTVWTVEPIPVQKQGRQYISVAVHDACSGYQIIRAPGIATSPQIILLNDMYACCVGGEDQLNTIGCNLLGDYFVTELHNQGVHNPVEEALEGDGHYIQHVLR
jgi:hypothetical protein